MNRGDILSNETTEKDNVKREGDEMQQNKVSEFIYVKSEVEMEDFWTEPTGDEPDPLTLLPAVEFVKVETQSTEMEYATTTDACPSASQEISVQFSCEKCGYKCSTIEQYQDHVHSCSHSEIPTVRTLTTHVERKISKCTENNHSASKLLNIDNHKVMYYIGGKQYKCIKCDYSTARVDDLKKHLITHSVKNQFNCAECNYTAPKLISIKLHMRVHRKEKSYMCTEFDCSISKPCSICNHKIMYIGDKPYRCTKCDYSAPQLSNLKTHLKMHYSKKQFNSATCDYTTPKFIAIKVDTGEHTYKYTECDNNKSHLQFDSAASKPGNVNTSKMIYIGEKPYKCTKCDYAAAQLYDLKTHIKVHYTKKYFKCTECDYTAPNLRTIKYHIKIHMGEKSYKCTQCDYVTSKISSMKIHLQLHSVKKTFKCKECSYSSSQLCHVKRHMKVHRRREKL